MALALAITDQADGTGATATVSGSAVGSTNTVKTAPAYPAGSTWTSHTPRTGDGDLDVAVVPGGYWALLESDDGGDVSTAPVVHFRASYGDEANGTLITEEVADIITAAAFVDAAGNAIAAQVTEFPPNLAKNDTGKAAIIAWLEGDSLEPYPGSVSVTYTVGVCYAEARTGSNRSHQEMMRREIQKLFLGKNLESNLWPCVAVSGSTSREAMEKGKFQSVVFLDFLAREIIT